MDDILAIAALAKAGKAGGSGESPFFDIPITDDLIADINNAAENQGNVYVANIPGLFDYVKNGKSVRLAGYVTEEEMKVYLHYIITGVSCMEMEGMKVTSFFFPESSVQFQNIEV